VANVRSLFYAHVERSFLSIDAAGLLCAPSRAAVVRIDRRPSRLRSKSSVAALVARLKLAGYLDPRPIAGWRPRGASSHGRWPTRRFGWLPEAVDDADAEALTIDDYLIERPSSTVLIG
jgi:hypothetical protein